MGKRKLTIRKRLQKYLPFAILAIMFIWHSVLYAQEQRFPRPEFEGGYTFPTHQFLNQRDPMWEYMDVAVLVGLLLVTAWMVLKKRSRQGLIWISVFSLAYFGFYRQGCICAIGSVQNMSLALFNDNYSIPLSALLFFIIPLIFALLFGRVFCAGVCPLGAIQELTGFRQVRVPKSVERILAAIPFVYLGLAILFAATESQFLICRYDPFVGIFRIDAPYTMVIFGSLLLITGIFVNRPYCRYLCPYGVLQNIFSRFSVKHVTISPAECRNCRLCESGCPYDAILQADREPKKEKTETSNKGSLIYLLTIPVLAATLAVISYNLAPSLSAVNNKVKLAKEIRFENDHNMQKLLLLGDEAIALGALDAGMSGMYAYPGTPSTEIMEYIQSSGEAASRGIQREWSVNEKTALETALGMSYAGKRAMVAMKHVGLNVAADPFINSAVTGVNGGLIVVAADDPSMHSSQNEQDSRFYGRFSNVPVFEPSNQQEAYDMVFDAFDLSEKYRLPVLFRITTRLAHSRSAVERRQTEPQKPFHLPPDPRQFVLLPSIARKKYKTLLSTYESLKYDNRISKFNVFRDGNNRRIGVITCGIAYNYLMENFPDREPDFPVLKITAYPFPKDVIRDLTSRCEEVLVLEEGYPIIEEALRGILDNGSRIIGRLDGAIPRDGELNPSLVAKAIGFKTEHIFKVPSIVKTRPPSFCKGCGHSDTFISVIEALKPFKSVGVFSDIGCYTLAALPPYSIITSCVDMGASVTMAVGAADAGMHPSVAVVGDSTFTHSGMTGLLDAVVKNSPVTIIISDNSTTGMTGGQKSHATGRLLKICEGIGVVPDHIKIITPLRKNHEENVRIMQEEFIYHGVSVIISARECIQTASRRKKAEASETDSKEKTV